MTNSPPTTVSIITPSYNQGTFIRETIESILRQEGDFFLDYIIVDGTSTDNGEILSWLNSDDTLLPGALSKVVERFLEIPSTWIIYGKVRYIDAEGHAVGDVDTGPTDHARLAVLNEICQPGTFPRRSDFDAAGGLDPSLHYVMDHYPWIRMTLRGTPIFLPEFLASYRLHGESKTAAKLHAVAFQRETIGILRRHYTRAPLNRVYACCDARVRSGFPEGFPGAAWLAIPPTMFWTLWEYLRLNRRVNVEDLRMIRSDNLQKILRGGTAPPEGR
ncbi:MAG: glycosyltransferase [Deltaproteobacteria bacterium]|nr:glycosyltransferase [Candidatus Deferrimicrobium borealis]